MKIYFSKGLICGSYEEQEDKLLVSRLFKHLYLTPILSVKFLNFRNKIRVQNLFTSCLGNVGE